jgi:CheY-like chemotaxis protein
VSLFTLLAADAVLAPTTSESTPRLHLQPHQTLRILLADDNVTNQLIICKMLRRLGHTNVTTVGDGQQAVDVCATGTFDMILMDLMMPVMNGWAASARIRATAGTPVFIAALTAASAREDLQKCLDVGMDQVLRKPIQVAELAAAVDLALLKVRADVRRT